MPPYRGVFGLVMVNGSSVRRGLLVASLGGMVLLGGQSAQAQAPSQACHTVLESPPLEGLARKLGGSELDMGLLGSQLVNELVDAVCSGEITRWAGASCQGSANMDELRRRVALDILRLPVQINVSVSPRAQEVELSLALAAAVADTWLVQGDLAWFAQRLQAEARPTPEFLRDACALGAPRTSLQASIHISTFLTELSRLDRSLPKGEQVEQLSQVVQRLGVGDTSSLRVKGLITRVIEEYERIQGTIGAPPSIEDWTELGLLSAELFVGQRLDLAGFVTASSQLLRGNLRVSSTEAIAWLSRLGGVIPSSVQTSLDIASAFSLARDEGSAKRILARALLPLGPWSENILTDINLGTVSLSDRGYSFAGDLLLGYQTSDFGVDVRGAVYEYDISKERRIIQISQRELQLEGWLNIGSEKFSVETRAEGKFAYFDSTRISAVPGETLFFDETSYMGRGVGLLGLRAQPSMRFAGGLWLGAGFQYEDYSPLQTLSSTSVSFADETNTALIMEARFRMQWALWPQYLVARLRADGVRYEMARQNQTSLVSAGAVQSSEQSESATTLEAHARGYLDAELARFWGFVPGLYAGFDYLSIDSSSQGTLSSFAPVFGAGIRRVSF